MPATTADRSPAAATVESARAKINLTLHVTGRRRDGYHLLDSLVVFAELSDTLTASPRETEGVGLTVDGPFAATLDAATPPGGNLVLRAVDALIAARPGRVKAGFDLRLSKRLPVSAGLGGGSADAAATLRLLNTAWRLGIDAGELAGIGLEIGADVPVCLLSRAARIGGIGESVAWFAGLPELPLVLLHPGVAVATGAVFARLPPATRTPMAERLGPFRSIGDLAAWLRTTRNDLVEPATAIAPAIAAATEALANGPDCLFARMSGSGASVFGIFPSRAAAKRAAARLKRAHPGWWVATSAT